MKLIVSIGDPLVGRLLVHDALSQSWDVLTVHNNPDCAVCGACPTVTEPVDDDNFCAAVPSAGSGTLSGMVPAVAGGPVPQISALELADLLAGNRPSSGVGVVDVRGSQEQVIASIPRTRAIHLDEFRSGAAVSQTPFDHPVVILCRAGGRSEETARILIAAGHPDVRSLAGGVLGGFATSIPLSPSIELSVGE